MCFHEKSYLFNFLPLWVSAEKTLIDNKESTTSATSRCTMKKGLQILLINDFIKYLRRFKKIFAIFLKRDCVINWVGYSGSDTSIFEQSSDIILINTSGLAIGLSLDVHDGSNFGIYHHTYVLLFVGIRSKVDIRFSLKTDLLDIEVLSEISTGFLYDTIYDPIDIGVDEIFVGLSSELSTIRLGTLNIYLSKGFRLPFNKVIIFLTFFTKSES